MSSNCNFTLRSFTTLVQIEGILNYQPLTRSNALDHCTLSYWTGASKEYQNLSTNHLTDFQRIEQLRQHFWTRWSKKYVLELQQRNKQHSRDFNLKLRSLVLMKEENLPPVKWNLGCIVALYQINQSGSNIKRGGRQDD